MNQTNAIVVPVETPDGLLISYQRRNFSAHSRGVLRVSKHRVKAGHNQSLDKVGIGLVARNSDAGQTERNTFAFHLRGSKLIPSINPKFVHELQDGSLILKRPNEPTTIEPHHIHGGIVSNLEQTA